MCEVAASGGTHDGTSVHRALHAAEDEVNACERVLSRFDSRSDLSRLNRTSGEWVAVDERLVEALAAAARGRIDTGGLFDPTILPALTAAGYDRSFELLSGTHTGRLGGWRAGARIGLDPSSGAARIERGAAVDLGGIGKGFAATRALNAMLTVWPALPGALVDLGGDIAVWGRPPEGGPWRVEIGNPRGHEPCGTLELTSGGVATSGRDTRRFGPGKQLHHLIDPATGVPAEAGPLSVTVVAADATEADTYATAIGIATVAEARNLLAARPDLAAFLIPGLGEPVAIGPLPIARTRSSASRVVTTQVGRFSCH
jgi:thiamine biosynthesis lipoprotein